MTAGSAGGRGSGGFGSGGRAILEVVRAGPLTTVQDLGRPGLAHLGVTRSGAADRRSLRLANRLVGNPEGEAGLEVTLGGLAVRADADVEVVVTGAACPVTVDGRPVGRNAVLAVRAGQVVALGSATAGLRAYLAVRGGVAVPPVLGSRSRDTLAGIGPEPVEAGDVVPIGPPPAAFPVVDLAPVGDPFGAAAVGAPGRAIPGDDRSGDRSGDEWSGAARLDVLLLDAVPGPRADLVPAAVLAQVWSGWVVDPASDRVGVRFALPPGERAVSEASGPASGPASGATSGLTSAAPSSSGSGTATSEPMVRGAVQVPPSGLPVVFGADHPVTGGYPVVAVLTDAAADLAAQLRPGQRVRLRRRRPDRI